MMDEFTKKRADKLFQSGIKALKNKDYEKAKDEFKASMTLIPTADALTYLGWIEDLLGNSKNAIKLCFQAIQLDPEFGNAYNDIGRYLLNDGKTEESIMWFEKSINSPRNNLKQFSHLNLGNIYSESNQPMKAFHHYKQANKISPNNKEIKKQLESIKTKLVPCGQPLL